MKKANNVVQQPETLFGAYKKAIAKLMGVKRLQHGADFAEDASPKDPFVGKRQHNMGDLWREPMDKSSNAESATSQPDLFDTLPEQVASKQNSAMLLAELA
jgi:hypothetical protein